MLQDFPQTGPFGGMFWVASGLLWEECAAHCGVRDRAGDNFLNLEVAGDQNHPLFRVVGVVPAEGELAFSCSSDTVDIHCASS